MKLINSISWHFKRFFKKMYFFLKVRVSPIVEISDIKLILKKEWSYTVKDHLIKKDYETSEIEIIKNNINKDDKVLEIGTGLGYIASFCAKTVGNDNVTTIEANPFLQRYHNKVFNLNNVKPKVIYNAVGTNNAKTTFYIDKMNFWASSLIPFKAKKLMEIEVDNVDINELIKEKNPTFLIIDVEGYEYELIKQIKDFSFITKIQIETHPKIIGQNKIEIMVNQLKESGFKLDMHYSINDQFFLKK